MSDDQWQPLVEITFSDGQTLGLRLVGDLDLAGVPILASVAAILPDRLTTRHVTIDVSSVSFADCAGIRALNALRQALADAGATVTLEGLQPAVQSMLLLVNPAAALVDLAG